MAASAAPQAAAPGGGIMHYLAYLNVTAPHLSGAGRLLPNERRRGLADSRVSLALNSAVESWRGHNLEHTGILHACESW